MNGRCCRGRWTCMSGDSSQDRLPWFPPISSHPRSKSHPVEPDHEFMTICLQVCTIYMYVRICHTIKAVTSQSQSQHCHVPHARSYYHTNGTGSYHQSIKGMSGLVIRLCHAALHVCCKRTLHAGSTVGPTYYHTYCTSDIMQDILLTG